MFLCADIGGTNSRFALWEPTNSGSDGRLLDEWRIRNQDHSDFLSVLKALQTKLPNSRIERAVFAVAGPLHTRTNCELTNVDFLVETSMIQEFLAIARADLINDLEATAYGIAKLESNQLWTLYEPSKKIDGNRAVLSPGTGLGEAGLYFDGNSYHPFATEGGHADFAPRTEEEIELLRFLLDRHTSVGYEDIASGQGLLNIFDFLEHESNNETFHQIRQQMQTEDPAQVITKRALQESCPICLKAVRLFTHALASDAANLGLKLKATGGIYLGGGILRKIMPLMKKPWFLERFFANEKMEELLKEMPISIILTDQVNLLGAACFAERH